MNETEIHEPGVILRKRSYGESDEIIEVFLKHSGVGHFFARRSRVSQKRFVARLDILTPGIFVYKNSLSHGSVRSLLRFEENLDEHVQKSNQQTTDIFSFAYTQYLAELILIFLPEGASAPSAWERFMNYLASDSQKNLSYFFDQLVGFLGDFGFALSIAQCAKCQRDFIFGDAALFCPQEGGSIGPCCAQGFSGVFVSVSNILCPENTEKKEMMACIIDFIRNLLQKPVRAEKFLRDLLEIA